MAVTASAKGKKRSAEARDWRLLASLGEQLINENSLVAQRDRIVKTINSLIEGKVDVWLDEKLFRLPNWTVESLFTAQPSLEGMKRALAAGKTFTQQTAVDKRTASRGTFVAVLLADQNLTLGAIQVSRSKGHGFSSEELDLLEGLAQIVTVGLFASHRVEVERFRLGQLNLVREVSAQIANVLDINELALRVTDLIQKTFNYYYVAFFTLNTELNCLSFRSSATASRKGRKKASISLQVDLGQGIIGRVAVKGEQIMSADVRADPRYRFVDSLPETRSELALPLKIEDRILGVLDVQSDKLDAFHPNDLLILNALADNIARALEGARLYNDLSRRAEQLSLIAQVSSVVNSTLDLKMLLQQVADLVYERFGYPCIQMFTVHPNRRLIEFRAGNGKLAKELNDYVLPLDDPMGIIPWVAREGKAILEKNVKASPIYRQSPSVPEGICCELTIPLVFDKQVLGVLDIQSDEENAFNEEDRLMFEAVGATIATAIRNADLYRSEQWRRRVADSLREVAGLLSDNVSLEQVLDAILTELEKNLPVDISAIWLLGENDMYLAAVHGFDSSAIENARRESPDAAIVLASALVADAPIIRKAGDSIGPLGLAAGFKDDYSSIGVALHVAGVPVGLITLVHHTPLRYGHEAQAMAVTFASYAAVAIENARLYDAAQEQAYASAALLQVAQSVVSMNDLEEILGSIIRIMPILVGVGRTLLYLWDDERDTYVPWEEYGLTEDEETFFWEHEFLLGEYPLLDAARENNRLVTQPVEAESSPSLWMNELPDLAQLEANQLFNGRLLISVPLSIKNDLFGFLLVEEALEGKRFRSRRLEIINGIAQQAALAIQNDRLQQEQVVRGRLETEVQLARQIQQTFIPDVLPQFPNWQLSARWITARQVGGDFYDVIQLTPNKLGLFIADVADKGMPAALFMALTRTLVRAAVLETESPAVALRRVNELLLPDTKQGMFVTAVYAVLDMERGELTYVNAGHNPPFLVMNAQGQTQKLKRTGVALGVMEQPNMREEIIQVAPGDSILFYTDGLSEAFAENGDMFGDGRLVDALLSKKFTSADELLSVVETRVYDFIGENPLGDDLTMLGLFRAE